MKNNNKSITFIFGLVHPYSNGVGNCTMQRAQCLVNAGFDVSIITNQIKKTDPIFEEYNGIKIHRIFHFKYAGIFLKPAYLLAACFSCYKKIKEINSDIIYGPLLYYGFLSAICGKLLGKISVTEAQGSDVIPTEIKGFFRHLVSYLSLKLNDVVVSTNVEFKEAMQKRVPDRKIYILPNFINQESIRLNRKKIDLDKNKFHIMTVGRLVVVNGVETKGISYVIKAMKSLDNCILHIFGDGPLVADFKQYAVENNLQDKVIFYGQISHDELLDYLYSGDVLILASLTEGFNMTVLEAAALETAVITTPLGGQKDYIIDGENGLFIKIADVESIVDQVKKIRDNKELKEKLAKNIYQTYLSKFTHEAWTKQFFEILKIEKIMKVAIIIPNDQFWCEEYGDVSAIKKGKHFPYSIAVVATYLKNNNINITVIDAQAENLDVKAVNEKLKIIKPDLIAIRLHLLDIDFDLQFAQEAKSYCQSKIIGLVYDDFADDILKKYSEIDAIVRREWASSLLQIVKKISNNDSIFSVGGLCYREDGVIKNNPLLEHILINDLPSPDFSLFPMKKYDYFVVLVSFGCSHGKCLFCHFGNYPLSGWECRDVDKIIQEIKAMQNYANRHFVFLAYEMTGNINFSKELLKRIIKEKLRISFETSMRVSTIDEELYDLLDKAGCTMIFFGVESGAQEIMDLNEKGLKLSDAKKSYELLKKRKMIIKVFFMVGLLGDSRENIEKTFRFVTETLQAENATFDIAIPYPDTAFFRILKQNGQIENLTLDNLIWIFKNIYGYKPIIDKQGVKPDWRIGDLTFDVIYQIWNEYHDKVPGGNNWNNLKIWIKKGYLDLAIKQFLHNPKSHFKRAKDIIKNIF